MNSEEVKKILREEGIKNGKLAWESKQAKYGDKISEIQRRGPAGKLAKKRGENRG